MNKCCYVSLDCFVVSFDTLPQSFEGEYSWTVFFGEGGRGNNEISNLKLLSNKI